MRVFIIGCQQLNYMDNLTIQITPLEVTYQHKEPLPLTCVFKKLVIATNHPLEKYEIKSQPEISAGKNRFNNGPIFALNKQFQLQTTKISLDFIAKKQRGVSCIGSAILDVATLPTQAQSLLDVNLSNCIYPHGKTKLHVKRKQESVQNKKYSKGKPQVMGILQTQSQLKQQLMLNRRTNPNIPTAYEISRKNYKQAETSCHETSTSKKQRVSVSKGSYQKRFHATNSSINSRLKTQTTKHKEESPRPRQKTPEPIQLLNGAKTQRGKQKQQRSNTQKYSIGHKNKPKQQQKIQEPQDLFVKPYQSKVQRRANQPQQTIQTNQNISSNISYNQLQKQKNNKYLDITQKLEHIQNMILSENEKKYKSEVESVLSQKQSQQSISQFNYNNKSEQDVIHQSYLEYDIKNESHAIKDSNISNKYSPIEINTCSPQLDTHRNGKQAQVEVQNESGNKKLALSKDNNVYKNTRQTSPTQKSDIVHPIQHKLGDSMLPIHYNSKMQIQELEGLNIQLSKQNELLRVKLYDAEQTVKKLMRELREQVMKTAQKDKQLEAAYNQKSQRVNEELEDKDKEIINISKQNEEYKKRINEQKNLLDKMTKEYEDNLDQIVILQDELETLKKSQISTAASAVRFKDPGQLVKMERDLQQFKQENIKITKKCVQSESSLKLKENEIRHLKIEINNVMAEKKQLEEEINVIARGKKEEMARQKSLAHIEQISNSSLTQLTKRENENLKNQVKILQQKIESFNKMLETVISQGGANKEILKAIQIPSNDRQRLLSKTKQLQEKVGLLQDQLRKKKNQFAQIVNIVFSFGDSQLMQSVERKLMQS